MLGAKEFYGVIKNASYKGVGGLQSTKLGTYGGDSVGYRWENVVFVTSTHARGKCFCIHLVDENNKTFEVYGVTGGQRGWTETYGWTHKGTWVKPILVYLRDLGRQLEELKEKESEEKRKRESIENKKIGETVDKFNSMFRVSM